ncbi:DUF2301 domain-containing membrane protein [Vibrio sp.]|nr:DUF2301 domain-containing membrane protein [Vibrio sp.]
MANPEHVENLDILDKLSVCFYRTGITLFGIGIICHAIILLTPYDTPESLHYLFVFLSVGSALCAANVHVYSKLVRYAIAWPAWLGIVLFLYDQNMKVSWLALGLLFITFSGIALKESFCFKVFGLKFIPVLLAASVLLLFMELWWQVAILELIAGLVLCYLAKEKWKMPLHYDIGDKSRYQI